MVHSLSLMMCCWWGTIDTVDTRFEQAYPLPKVKDVPERSPGQSRAILLVPGLRMHSFSSTRVHQAILHDWQAPSGHLVQALGKNADVFNFAYAQNVPVEVVARQPALANGVQRLRTLGYDEIILIGHSAGGIVARIFVEDNPRAGITRVLQIDSPNLGSSWARADVVRKDQEPFMHSLTKEERMKSTLNRQNKKVPPHVQFVCIVGSTGNLGDGLVSVASQWPEDLQSQGIPAIRFTTTHFFVVRTASSAARIAALAVQPQPRWTEEERNLHRKTILAP